MTATVVGLGGKATATSRGSSLKGFIQSGAGFAEISIWLKNGGPDAYRPDVYGGSIEVVRRIMADGAGMYKIKSCRGQVVSGKKEELSNILDQFNIQVCVCVCVKQSVGGGTLLSRQLVYWNTTLN